MNTANPIVMTLDAGGTNLVFSAICNGEEIVSPVTLPTAPHDLELCLHTIRKGFETIQSHLPARPEAISFAFPGPADYEAGIIGDLPNFPAFRNGVALGPYLEDCFGIPVFINNDGNLFAYGEALAGALPEINSRLEAAGNPKRYHNLLGVTLGTGFGGGVVIHGNLLKGDNQTGGYLWCLPHKKHGELIAEESVSIRGIQRIYTKLSGDTANYTPKEIYEIAEGLKEGNREAAKRAFAELGEVAGHAIATALTLIDGVVVIGGGIAGASKYILPALMKELREDTGMTDGTRFPRLQMKAYNLENPEESEAFLKTADRYVKVPESQKEVVYQTERRTGVILSRLGASRAIALGAYWLAVSELRKKNN